MQRRVVAIGGKRRPETATYFASGDSFGVAAVMAMLLVAVKRFD